MVKIWAKVMKGGKIDGQTVFELDSVEQDARVSYRDMLRARYSHPACS